MKKRFVLIITAVLIISLLVTGCAKATTPILSIESKTALIGDEIHLPIKIEKNSGLYVGQIVVNYDTTVFEFISGGNGDVFDECVVNGKDIKGTVMIIANQSGATNTKKDGTLASLNFKIKDIAPRGDSTISFSMPETVEDGTYFLDVKNISEEKWTIAECQNAVISVK
ncbi:MAG: hypothetical protein IKJ50_04965 [Clostridia bacterium]|nr:hypothetical protein [Clostridia bacterium]